jgi:hypothetical protein
MADVKSIDAAKQKNRARNITQEEEAAILEAFNTLADTIDGYIMNQPNVSVLNEVDGWMREMQSLGANLSQSCAQAEGFFALAMMHSVEEIDAETWKRIGKSSTLITQYTAGLYENRFVAWQRLNNLKTLLKTVMDNTRTLIVTARSEGELFKAGQVRNSQPPDVKDLPFP